MNVVQDTNINTNIKIIRLGTLGPSGTSSELAAKFYIENFIKQKRSKIFLFDRFEDCLENLKNNLLDYVVVPHAYEGIKDFYMSPYIDLLGLFRYDTPMYGLAVRKDFNFHPSLLDTEVIVSHSAPEKLIKFFLDKDVKILKVNSTSTAAKLVKDGFYNIAITNDKARENNDLKFVYKFKKIPMSWSVFGRREKDEQ